MTIYRPTTLRLATRHCPRAVDYYEQGRPFPREHFAVGGAAHAVLEAAGRSGEQPIGPLVDAAVRQLITTGRSFDGVPEAPLPIESVLEGHDLALAWLEAGGVLSPTAHYELGAGFDARWRPTGYTAPDARFHLIFDYLELINEEGEEDARTGVLHRDFKSAWSTDESELDTLQMKAQALAAWALATSPKRLLGYPESPPSFVRSEVVNLRTRETFSRELSMHTAGEGQELFCRWRADLALAMDALDEMARAGARPARPGAGCMGCAWVLSCTAAGDFLADLCDGVLPGDPQTLAQGFATAQGIRDALRDLAQAALDERGAVQIDGAVVGTVAKEGREPIDEVGLALLDRWLAGGGDPRGLLKALGPELGVRAVEGVAKVLHPGRARDQRALREQLVERLTVPRVRPAFGVHRGAALPPKGEP